MLRGQYSFVEGRRQILRNFYSTGRVCTFHSNHCPIIKSFWTGWYNAYYMMPSTRRSPKLDKRFTKETVLEGVDGLQIVPLVSTFVPCSFPIILLRREHNAGVDIWSECP